MKLGIIGLPGSGKSTIFEALTGARGEGGAQRATHADQRISTVKVFDERVAFLEEIFKPKKTTYAQVEYLLPSDTTAGSSSKSDGVIWNQVRICDALIHVLRNFKTPGGLPATPGEDFWNLEENLILDDLAVTERRLERIDADKKKGKKPDDDEYAAIRTCREQLEKGQPLRALPELTAAQSLRGFTFLSAKPQLLISNNDDENESTPDWERRPEGLEIMVVRGRLERDIAGMSMEEAAEFLEAYHIDRSALDRVIRRSYRLLDLISFFTVLNEEVRAWTLSAGSRAIEAAGTVHTDMQRGFIRAEVLSFRNLKEYGSVQEAKKAGHVSLEGKDYQVQDGDIINFRFNI
jgi:GTP-binding protein YchF